MVTKVANTQPASRYRIRNHFICGFSADKSLAILGALFFAVAGASAASSFQIADPVEFAKIIDTNTAVLTTNATVNAWLEGPVWIPSNGGYLLFCDQGGNRLRKIVLPNTMTDYLLPPPNTLYNGTMLDAQERLIGAQAGTGGLRIVMVTNLMGTNVVTVLNSTCNGQKFYSPNDIAVKSDGTIWVTDPGYNGVMSPPPQPGFAPGYYVYRFDPANGDATCAAVITNGVVRPNGLCFSPDETKFYVAESDPVRHRIQVYNVLSNNTLSTGSVFATVTNGAPDGIRCDVDGRIWSSGGDGAYIFAATDGHLIGKIKFVKIANLCFGGPEYKTVFMTGQPVVVSVPVLVAGEPSLKKLRASVDGGQLNLAWPAPSTGFALQESNQLDAPDSWTNSDLSLSVSNGQNIVTVDATNEAKFFRLRLN